MKERGEGRGERGEVDGVSGDGWDADVDLNSLLALPIVVLAQQSPIQYVE